MPQSSSASTMFSSSFSFQPAAVEKIDELMTHAPDAAISAPAAASPTPASSSQASTTSASRTSTTLPPIPQQEELSTTTTTTGSSNAGSSTDESKPILTVPLPSNFNSNRRTSVSGESLSPSNSTSTWRPRTVLKTPEQLERLNRIITQNFLFRGLDDEALKTVLNVLEEKQTPANVTIIKQGDEGEKFYLIESGSVDYHVNGEKLSSSGAGSSFGELALMYNAPRAATVITTEPCVLWVLDGTTFRRILMERTASKRSMYEGFLREVPVLTTLNNWERAKIADALKAVTFEAGETVVKEGEVGELFYLIEDGVAEVFKEGEGKVNELSKGDYFGELALLNDAPRAATVVAKTKLKTVYLDKSGFQRLIGSKVTLNTY
ncbi:cyclic nucleotide-binding-like protein [Myxozyma melibiosi]|uniref:cAMP-dependent protein kinase regulatory subunit n=1 Tax=Myxozyma melibiosi TaxID=54550 RepID=A0ABR1EZX1_9ASCO